MDSANGEKLDIAEKKTALLPTHNETRPKEEDGNADNMLRIQHFFFALLLVAILTFSLVSAASHNAPQPSALAANEQAKFQELLNTVEPGCLHEVLHQFMGSKYKHGVYQEDKTAMEALHQSNAEVAYSLIELAKRQGGGTTSSNGTATTSTSVSSDSTRSTEVASTSTTPRSSPPPSTSTTVPPTVSSTPQTTPTSTGSTATVIETSRASPSGSTTPSTTTASSTIASSSSAKSSSSPLTSASRYVTQQTVLTTTLPNGAQETVTRTTVVPADQAETGGAGGSSTNTATASLQSNGVGSDKSVGLNFVLGAMGLALAGAL